MASSSGGTVEAKESSALEDAVDDGGGEVVIVEDLAPSVGVFVGGEDHGALANVALVDDVEERIGSVVAVGEIADFIDDQDVGANEVGERTTQSALAAGGGEGIDERRGRHERRVEAVLDRAVREGDSQVRLSPTRLAEEDERAPLGHEVGRQERAHGGEP